MTTTDTLADENMTLGDELYADGSLPSRADASLDSLPRDCDHITLQCHTGRRIEGEWTGVRVAALLEAASVPGRATHVLVESTDDYRACLPIHRAMQALLAFEETRLDCDATFEVTPRLVAPDLDSRRAIKHVDRITVVRLAPDEDASEYEDLPE